MLNGFGHKEDAFETAEDEPAKSKVAPEEGYRW